MISRITLLRSHSGVSLQDLGRVQAAEFGVCKAGAQDQHFAALANVLLGNEKTDAVLEVPLGAVELLADDDVWLAHAGAHGPVFHNERLVSGNRSYLLRRGDRLRLGYYRQGVVGYLAMAGGFEAPLYFQSRSFSEREQSGPAINQGQQLQNALIPMTTLVARSIPYAHWWRSKGLHQLYYLADSAHGSLPKNHATEFSQRLWHVSTARNRMGIRFDGQPMTWPMAGIQSIGLACGSIQLPANGLPIVLHREHQTMGGYPLLGVLTPQSLNVLAQLRPGQLCQFQAIQRATWTTLNQGYQRYWQQLTADITAAPLD